MAALLTPPIANVDIPEPSNVTYIYLREDGNYEDAMCDRAPVYIDECQVSK